MLLIVDLSLQTRNNLKILGLVRVFSIVRDLDVPVTALLLRLPHLDPLLSGEVLVKLREHILRQAKSVQQWAVLDGV